MLSSWSTTLRKEEEKIFSDIVDQITVIVAKRRDICVITELVLSVLIFRAVIQIVD